MGELVKKPKKGNSTTYHPLRKLFFNHENNQTSHTYWLLMKKTPLKDSSGLSYEKQLELLAKKYPGYQAPELIDIISAVFLIYISTGVRLLEKIPDKEKSICYTYCKEKNPKHGHMIVGNFSKEGLIVNSSSNQNLPSYKLIPVQKFSQTKNFTA